MIKSCLSKIFSFALISLLSMPLLAANPQPINNNFATLQPSGSGVVWSIDPGVNFRRIKLTLSPDNGENIEIKSAHEPYSGALQDGGYSYELVVIPPVSPSAKSEMRAARQAARGQQNADVTRNLRAQGYIPRQRHIQSGYFTILNGQLVSPDTEEE